MIHPSLRPSFTLIELLVVIAIIGILSSFGVYQFNLMQKKSRDSERIAFVKNIQIGIEKYYAKYGEYPNAPCIGDRTVGWTPLRAMLTQFIDLPVVPPEPLIDKEIPGTPTKQDDGTYENHTSHWHYIVSGDADKNQHYLFQIFLESPSKEQTSGSAGVPAGGYHGYFPNLASPDFAEKGQQSFSIQPDSNSDPWGFGTSCYKTTPGEPDDGKPILCGYQRWPTEPVDPTAKDVNILCLGNVEKVASAPGQCDGVLGLPTGVTSDEKCWPESGYDTGL